MRSAGVLAAILILSSWTSAQAGIVNATVRIEPAYQEVGLGENFSIDIVGDFPQPILGWGLDLNLITAGVISQMGLPLIGPDWYPVFAPDGDHLAGISFPNGVSGKGVLLARVNFHANALGETDLTLSVTPDDASEQFALDPFGFANVEFIGGHVKVPEPATAGLTAVALWLIVAPRRRRSA